MNVTFEMNELVNGFRIVSRNGLTQFVAVNDSVSIVFETDAGEGRNYSRILRYTDKSTGRTYQAMRYLYKYVGTVQGLSNQLYMKYRRENV